MTKVYVLILTDYEGNDAVISVHATHASAEAAKTALLSRKGFSPTSKSYILFRALDIEEHDLTP